MSSQSFGSLLAIKIRQKKHALAAYKWAWADGEPFVRRYELNKMQTLLEKLGAEIPKLKTYNTDKDEKLPWENKVAAAIIKLREISQEGCPGDIT